MKKKQIIIGIDVSKATLDCFIHSKEQHFVVGNNTKGLTYLLEKIFTITKCKKEELFVCFENTGRYSKLLSIFLESEKIIFAMVPALEIKKSLGITRGKNDKVDSRRIAMYAYEKMERLIPTILPGEKIDRIKSLLSLREKLIKHRTSYKNGITDLYDYYKEGESNMIREIQIALINELNNKIDEIEKEIELEINNDASMSKNFKLIISVRGIGKIVGYYLIAFTGNFTSFINARSFACYCGIAPFAYSSGVVIGKSRIHPCANKLLKSLLNLSAMTSINIKGEYKEYYKKRIENGKNKMSTINIIRNKIIFRVFAVVKRGTPYVDLYKFVA